MSDPDRADLAYVRGAIDALYGSEGAARQREANAFLVEFASTEAAWRVGLGLLCDDTITPPPTVETLFFAANMIHTKARREWTKLSPAERDSLTQMIRGLLDSQRPALQHAALQSKLCGVFAVAMCAQPEPCQQLLQALVAQALLSHRSAALLVTFARCVCEEMDVAELSFAAKDAMELVIASLSTDVLRVLSDLILAHGTDASALRGDALVCLSVWMKKAGTSLTRLYSNHPSLLRALVESLGQASAHMRSCADVLCHVFKVSEYPTAALQDEALASTASSLLSLRVPYEAAVAAEEEDIAHCITDVMATFCETYADWIVADDGYPQAESLGAMLLLLGSHPRRQIASLTLEFWLLVQEESVADRSVYYRRQALEQLLQTLLRQSMFPCDPDEMDDFERDDLLAYRSGSQGVVDVLLSIFAQLKHEFLALVLAEIGDASDWRVVEGVVFVISCVADDVKKLLLSPTDPRRDAVEALVMETLGLLFRAADTLPHPQVTAIGAKLVGQLSTWLDATARRSGSLDAVTTVLRYLHGALGVAASQSAAARSFMQVTTSCAAHLVDASPALLTSASQHLSHRGLEISDRLLIVEGLVRVAAQSRHATELLGAVLNGVLGRLELLLAETSNEELLATAVCEELQLLSKIVRFLDAPSEAAGGRRLTLHVVETLWPHLPPVVARVGHVETTAAALFELLGWCLQSARAELAPQLPLIATLVVQSFEQHTFVAPLECACIAVDVFGRSDPGDHVVSTLRSLLGALSRVAFHFFTARGVHDAPDMLRAFFDLAYRGLLCCPAALLSDVTELSVLLALARACVGNQERASANAVLSFVTLLLQESRGRLAAFHGAIDALFWRDAELLAAWVDAALSALATQSPSVLYGSVAQLLWALYTAAFEEYGVQVASTVATSLATRADALALAADDRARVAALWFRYAEAPTAAATRRFRSLCGDFAKLCRQEMTVDVLQTYEEEADSGR
ncbi:hypothetical protein P43SY_002872 [Pythium insidiosum]|uniref:Importin N-terminal domain-containing protein n=1 Tax=Pythium insidiosum TaxID=114742 RepID=A0AAD5LQ95_PYTIN|nr:hypothetical protein P43SY_002872 [Pythium insidiosum]